jgi:hypothetical protein
MTREEMIQLLVIHGVECADTFRGTLWLQKKLELGFPGYANLSNEALAAEIAAQGLDRFTDPEEEHEDWLRPDDGPELTGLIHKSKQELQDW